MGEDAVIRLEGLTKRYGRKVAVDRLDLAVERGRVFGFLGRNGAGKTTTIQMMLRLIRPSAGRVTLFGRDLRREPLAILPRVGALFEQPAFHPHLSGRRNLELLARLSGGRARSRIDEILDALALRDAAASRFATYSQGMRQALGIARALLHEPELLVLDEPTNGLDPEAIQRLRALLRRLAREKGTTCFISSHLLWEVEMTCDAVAIVDRGRLVVQGSVQELLHPEVGEIDVDVDDPAKARDALRDFRPCLGVHASANGGIRVRARRSDASALNARLVERGVAVSRFAPRRRTLEDFFLERVDDGTPRAGESGA